MPALMVSWLMRLADASSWYPQNAHFRVCALVWLGFGREGALRIGMQAQLG